MINKSIASMVVVLCLAMWVTMAQPASAQSTLIGSPFITSYDGWTDTFDYGLNPCAWGDPTWGVLLSQDTGAGGWLIESSDGAEANGTGGDGKYLSYMLVNSDVTPSTYTLDATMATYDNDGFGIVFGYQDNDNYFRVGLRSQTGSQSFGFYNPGISVQKVVGGVFTQLATTSSVPFSVSGPTSPSPFNLSVGVYIDPLESKPAFDVKVDDTTYLTVIDYDEDLQAGSYGVASWRQNFVDATPSASPHLGTALQQMQVSVGGNVTQSHDFTNVWPVSFKNISMTRSDGVQDLHYPDPAYPDGVAYPSNDGSFRLNFNHGRIIEQSNTYRLAVDNYPTLHNTDFIGPAIIVDESGSQDLENYEMQVRMSDGDDDGVGVLVRVQQDAENPDQLSFYRVFFEYTQPSDLTRPPRGMSIQKCVANGPGSNPTWETIFYEDPETLPQFLYTPRLSTSAPEIPFDVKVKVVNNASDTAATIYVEVINDPEGDPTTITYDPVVDDDNPILTGTVGLFSWGNACSPAWGDPTAILGGFGAVFEGYGGDPDAPLVVSVPSIPEIPGDANRDGSVDGDDAAAVADNWGATTLNLAYDGWWEMGDFDNDEYVGPKDAAIMSANWGYVWTGEESPPAAVPEPGAIVLLLGALATMAAARRQK
jgi:hypothetical protein